MRGEWLPGPGRWCIGEVDTNGHRHCITDRDWLNFSDPHPSALERRNDGGRYGYDGRDDVQPYWIGSPYNTDRPHCSNWIFVVFRTLRREK